MSHLGISGRILATDVDWLAPALQAVDRQFLVPRSSNSAFIPTIRKICRDEKVRLLLPLIDPDIPVLAKHRDELREDGVQVGVVSPQAAAVCADKVAVCQFFQKLGLATPKCWLPHELPARDRNFPLFVKPRFGSAAVNTFRANNERELSFFEEYVPEAIIQEFLSGPEITSDIVCDYAGKLLSVVSRQRIAVRTGEVVKGFTMFDDRISHDCQKIAESLPAIGPITAQCIVHNGIPHFIEINARMGGGLPLAIAAGVDVPKLLLATAAGIPFDRPRIGDYQTGLYITRFDDSYFLPEMNDA
jgi:carbamoyl-phosphate synthase large subunit